MTASNHRLYTPTFWTLCVSYAFFSGSFNMIIPELPSYLADLGGEDYKGLIIALFTLTAGLSRPFSGKLTDVIGRRPVMVIGCLVCVGCSLLYPILATVGGFLLLRLLHGFSTGFSPTAMTAYIADIVPVQRRGEAMGIIGVSMNLGSSISPPLGSYLTMYYSSNMMFLGSALLAVISMILILRVNETLYQPRKFDLNILRLKKNEIISRNAVFPALVCGLSYLGFGAILTVTPDQCEYLGMSNKGMFFTSYTVCSILSRLVAGTISDRLGRIPVMRVAVVLLAISYFVFGLSESSSWLLMASGLVGFSIGILVPAVFAWTVDRSSEKDRGKSFATLFIGLEIAIGTGALMSAAVYQNNHENFDTVFLITAFISMLAIFFVRNEQGVSPGMVR